MNRLRSKPLAAALLSLVLLLTAPVSLDAARVAVRLWLENFLPAMLPFFLLMPFLTCPEARDEFSRVFGKLLPRVFAIPGQAAGPVLTALVAGSPAGALACASIANELSPDEYERCVFLCSGVSPAFLVTSVGVGFLGSARAGAILLVSHCFALAVGCILLRRSSSSKTREYSAPHPAMIGHDPMLAATLRLLGVLGWMILFSVLSALLRLCMRNLFPEWLIAGLCEVSTGAAALAAAPIPPELRTALVSCVCCFGGLCVAAQVLSATGVSPLRLLGVKVLHAALGGAAALAMERLCKVEPPVFSVLMSPDPFALSVAVVSAIVLSISVRMLLRRPDVDEAACKPYTDT